MIAKADRIKCPAPLPEDPAEPRLMKMLVPVPYQAPEKKGKKKAKEAKGGPRRRGPSDTVSGETEILSSHEGDEEEEEEEEAESDSPSRGGGRRVLPSKTRRGRCRKEGG